MKFYQELTLRPCGGLSSAFIWGKLYQKLHLALAAIKNAENIVPIGVSFPEYCQEGCRFGDKLRIFAQEDKVLVDFSIEKRLGSVEPYIHISELRDVPTIIKGYSIYERKQSKSNNDRLARRRMRCFGISLEEAREYFSKREEKYLEKPYINMFSLSSTERFRLFIHKKETLEYINKGFNSYGLSKISSVPEF